MILFLLILFFIHTYSKKKKKKSKSHTCTLLSIAQVWRYGDGASLSDTDSNETLVHASDHVAEAHIGVIGMITRVAAGQKKSRIFSAKKSKTHADSASKRIQVYLNLSHTDFSAALRFNVSLSVKVKATIEGPLLKTASEDQFFVFDEIELYKENRK